MKKRITVGTWQCTEHGGLMHGRHLGLGGSDMNILCRNNEEDVHRLYKEKVQEIEPKDLSDVFPVQLGILTEQLNLSWFEKEYLLKPIENINGQNLEHKDFPYFCHFDGVVPDADDPLYYRFIECKHTNTFGTDKDKITSYLPQLQFYLWATQCDWCWLSIIRGNQTPKVFKIHADKKYQKQLYEVAKTFWQSVKDKKPLYKEINLTAEDSNYDVNDWKDYNMQDSEWDKLSDNLDQTQGAVEIYNDTKTKLKSIVPKDAKTATTVKSIWIAVRSKNNRLSIRKKNEKELENV